MKKLFNHLAREYINWPTYKYHFIHIPKNGGMAVRKRLSERGDVYLSEDFHFRYIDCPKKNRKKLSFFCVVRNPWSRTASRFIYSRERATRWPNDDPRKSYILSVDFDQFVRDQAIFDLKAYPGMPWMGPMTSWYNQLDWIVDEHGQPVCDCLRFEKLNADLSRYFGSNIIIPNVNITETSYDYRAMYTDETNQIIRDTFAKDIQHFGFEFDSAATRGIISAPKIINV